MMKRLLLIGGGGHARVVIDAVRAASQMEIVAIVDDRAALSGDDLDGVPVFGPVDPTVIQAVGADLAFIAIGDCAARSRIATSLDGLLPWAKVVHPHAWISPSSRLGVGVFIAAMAVVQPGVEIGNHVIVNTAASVDHDSQVERFAHIGPGARLCGNTHVGESAFIGAGATITPGIRIGTDAVVGAGAAVVHDASEGCTVVGVPARILRNQSSP